MKKKTLLLAAALALICLSLAGYGTYAYYAAETRTHNVVTSGSVKIRVVEKTEKDGELVDFPAEGLSRIAPGTSASKIVSVENTGGAPAWVRMKVAIAAEDAQGQALDSSVISFDSGEGWADGGDGFYYYQSELLPGTSTEPLMREVHFAPEMGNEYRGCSVKVTVEAHAVQCKNNPVPDGGSVRDVSGWPEA